MIASPFRHRPWQRAALVGVSGLLTMLLFCSGASAFQIVPISQDFEPAGRASNQVFQVENDRDEPVTVTIAIAKRTMDIDGNETMQETEDFTVFPTEIILQPKASRAVRVKWVGETALASELPYRIIAEETPLSAPRDTPGASVVLTIRYVGSIYVVPRRASHNVVVASARPVPGPQGGNRLELVLENKGTRHAILDQPTLALAAGGRTINLDKAVVDKALNGENILAGAQRRVLLPWPADVLPGPVSATLKYSAQ